MGKEQPFEQCASRRNRDFIHQEDWELWSPTLGWGVFEDFGIKLGDLGREEGSSGM